MEIEAVGAIISGGASGLGEATARRLHGAGASVLIADLNEEKGEALADELGERAAFAPANVTDEDSMQAAVDTAVELAGRWRSADRGRLRGDRLGAARCRQGRPASRRTSSTT